MRLLNEDVLRELHLRIEEEKSLKKRIILKKIVGLFKELD